MERPDTPAAVTPADRPIADAFVASLLVGAMLGLIAACIVDLVEHHRARRVADQFQSEITFARREAMIRHQPIVVCRTRNYRACTHSGPWSTNVLIFEDEDRDHVLDANETLLRVRTAAEFDGLHLVGTLNRPVIGFMPNGSISSGVSGNFRLCDPSLKAMRLMALHPSGRTSSRRAGLGAPDCGAE